MNKKRLIAFLTALSCVAAAMTALAASQSDADYDPNRGVVETTKVPDQNELHSRVQEAKNKGNNAAVRALGGEDYSDFVGATEKITVTIDENDMWEYHPEVFGMQIEGVDCYSTFYQNGQFNKKFRDLVERGAGKLPLFRFGGTSSMSVDPLYNMIGPVKERKNTPKTSYTKGEDTFSGGGAAPFQMGIPEWYDLFKYLNGDDRASYMPCLNVWTMPYENVVNFAKYCYDDADESEWGAMRAADGYEEPLNIYYWELGNELDYVSFRTQTRIDEYVTKATAMIEAIKSVNPDARILANGVTAPWGNIWDVKEYSGGASWTSWHMGIMPRLVGLVDAISFHPYYDGYSVEFGNTYFTDKMKRDIDIMVAEQDLRDKDGNLKDIKVIATEHNRWTDPSVLNSNFWSAMSVSHFYNAVFSRPWYVGATLHGLIGDWSGFWFTGSGDILMTPTAVMHKMYYENIGDRICKSSWVRHEPDGTIYDPLGHLKEDMSNWGNSESFSVLATPSGEHELKVFLTNKNAYTNREITFDFKQHNYTLVSETRVYAPNSGTFAIDKESEAFTKIETKELNVPNCTTYTTPTQGVVCLTFRTTDRMLQLGEEASAAEGGVANAAEVSDENLAFTDITDSYARNEITALALQSIISGTGNGGFNPKGNITRAEFSYILGKSMGLLEYKGNLWDDVAADKWYAGMLNALFIENVFKGSYFRPDEPMTLGEVMELAGQLCKKNGAMDTGEISGDYANLSSDASYAVSRGIFSKLLENTEFNTDRYMTREDAAAIMYKLSKLI